MKPLLIRFLAILFGLLLFWGGAEVATRLIYSHRISYDLEMWKYARQVKTHSMTPKLRFEHRPGVEARLMGVNVTINEHGLRDRPLSFEKPPGTIRVAVLGDSVTFGWGVPQQQTYPVLLENLINQSGAADGRRYQVLNFGVGNYNTVDELAILQHKVWDFAPDILLLGYFVNDVEQHVAGDANPILSRSAFAVWIWGRVDQLLRRCGWRPDYVDYYRQLYDPEAPGYQQMARALRGIVEEGRQRKVPVVLAMLPDLHQLNPYPFGSIHAKMKTLAETEQTLFVDLLKGLPDVAARNMWVAPDDPHPNGFAQQAFARQLAAEIPWNMLLREQQTGRKD